MRAIHKMLVGYNVTNMDNKELENIILRAMHHYSLIEIFSSKKPTKYESSIDHSTDHMFNMSHVPSDNQHFRKVFNKIYTYAKHIMMQLKKKESDPI